MAPYCPVLLDALMECLLFCLEKLVKIVIIHFIKIVCTLISRFKAF